MDELRELYQQVILDHNRNPKNYGKIDCNHEAEGFNPLCGDKIKIYVQVDGDTITDVHFEAAGCAISKASASLMTVALKGKTIAEAQDIFSHFIGMITGKSTADAEEELLGSLIVLAGVREFPSRVKCAGLAWHAFNAALSSEEKTVTTE
ncbi:MAG: SUF system NifU family Fe-S cluster assembly protein [Calditrichia bacterium]